MTSVCAGGAPRIETSAIVPGEPSCVTFRLGISRNASVTLWICCDWIWGLSRTDAVSPISPSGCAIRVAVTIITIWGSLPGRADGDPFAADALVFVAASWGCVLATFALLLPGDCDGVDAP